MSEITNKAYAKAKEKRAKAKAIENLLADRRTWVVPQDLKTTLRMALEDEALEHYRLELKREAAEIETALFCGSEDGNLKTHIELEIYNGCLELIEDCARQIGNYFKAYDVELLEGERVCLFFNPYEIVGKLFCRYTLNHTGDFNSAAVEAKCRRLGIEKPYKVLEFECFNVYKEE